MLAQVKPGELSAQLPAAAPEQPEQFADVLRDLDELLLPALTNWQSPRFFAYFATTGAEPGILAELLIAGLNQVGILWRTSPALQELEELTVDWLRQLVGLPGEFKGHIEDTASTGVLAAANGRNGVAEIRHEDDVTCREVRVGSDFNLHTPIRNSHSNRHRIRSRFQPKVGTGSAAQPVDNQLRRIN